jgi:hypothetical protein
LSDLVERNLIVFFIKNGELNPIKNMNPHGFKDAYISIHNGCQFNILEMIGESGNSTNISEEEKEDCENDKVDKTNS